MKTQKKISANQLEVGDKIVIKDYSIHEITASKLNRNEESIRICYDGYCVKYSYNGIPFDKKQESKEIIGVIKPQKIWNAPYVTPRKNNKYALIYNNDNIYQIGYIDDCSFFDESGKLIPMKQEVKKWAYLDKILEIVNEYDAEIKK